jgi:transposase InsO family protein
VKSRKKGGIRTIDMMIRNSESEVINHKKIERIKNEYGLITEIRRKNPYKHLPGSENAQIPNLLQREFVTPLPDNIYSTDMTYLFYGRGEKAYLSATKDLGTNEIVSYNLMRTPSVGQFIEEFRKKFESLPINVRSSLVVHSDQGFQYTHEAFRNLLKEAGVTQSMSRRGNCIDNAPIESFFGHFKDLLELKKCKTFEDVADEIKTMIDYYNKERPQKALNKKPPAVYRGLISSFF